MCFWRLPCNSSFKYDECCFSRKTVFRIVEVDIFFCTRTLFKEWLARFDIDYDPSAIIVWISESSIESHIVHIWQIVHLESIFETRLRIWLFRESFHRKFWRYTCLSIRLIFKKKMNLFCICVPSLFAFIFILSIHTDKYIFYIFKNLSYKANKLKTIIFLVIVTVLILHNFSEICIR